MAGVPIHWHTGSGITDPNQFVADGDGRRRYVRPDLPPGSARFGEARSGQPYLSFTCPCGCGSVGVLPLLPMMPLERGWSWNADRVFPTLAPSIQKTSPCRWHGQLEKGAWIEVPAASPLDTVPHATS